MRCSEQSIYLVSGMQKLEQNKHEEGFLDYIHYFRAIAITLIVGVHVLDSLERPENLQPIMRFLEVLVDDSTLLFVLISGFLFQHLAPKFEAKTYFFKKALYVFLPYIAFSVPIILI